MSVFHLFCISARRFQSFHPSIIFKNSQPKKHMLCKEGTNSKVISQEVWKTIHIPIFVCVFCRMSISVMGVILEILRITLKCSFVQIFFY